MSYQFLIIPNSLAAVSSAEHNSSTSSIFVELPMEILMLDIRMLWSMFIADRTLSALPLELDEHALPADRQKPLSDMTRRKTSEGIGFEQMFMM